MKKTIFLAVLALFFACSQTEEMATVTINTGFGSGGASSLTSAAVTPANVVSFSLRISAPDMKTIEAEFPAVASVITLLVPVGKDRKIVLDANIDPADPSALLSYRGISTTDLGPGANLVRLDMGPGNTKIIIPEPHSSYNRLVQMNSFSNPSWMEIAVGNLTGLYASLGTFAPWDIAYDRMGRIYIANNMASTGGDQVIRIDNFTTPNAATIVQPSIMAGIKAIAIDWKNNILYHSRGGTDLRWTDIEIPDGGTAINVSSLVTNIVALACDEEGMLYIADAGDSTGPDDQIIKTRIDPNSNQGIQIGSAYTSNLDFIFNPYSSNYTLADIAVLPDYIYIANHDGPDGYKIIQLTRDLKFVQGFGILETTLPNENGHFYGPHYFAAIRNDVFFIIDEGGDATWSYNKLVSMKGMNGDDWQVFDPGTLEESFQFYYFC